MKAKLIAALALLGAQPHTAQSGTSKAEHALDMTWSQQGKLVEIRIVGKSTEPLDLRYTLKVIGDSRTSNSGRVRLANGTEQIVSTVRFNSNKPWQAVLQVEGDRSYVITLPA